MGRHGENVRCDVGGRVYSTVSCPSSLSLLFLSFPFRPLTGTGSDTVRGPSHSQRMNLRSQGFRWLIAGSSAALALSATLVAEKEGAAMAARARRHHLHAGGVLFRRLDAGRRRHDSWSRSTRRGFWRRAHHFSSRCAWSCREWKRPLGRWLMAAGQSAPS